MLVMWNQVVKTFKGQLNWVARIFSLQFSQEATKTRHALPSSSCVGKWRDRCSSSSSTQVITKLGVCLLNHCQIPASSHQIHAQHLPFTNAGIPLKAKDRDNQRATNVLCRQTGHILLLQVAVQSIPVVYSVILMEQWWPDYYLYDFHIWGPICANIIK